MSQESTPVVEIALNGSPHTVPDASSVKDLLRSLGISADRVAVELNRSIVRKDQWDSALIHGGDEVEIVHFVGGG